MKKVKYISHNEKLLRAGARAIDRSTNIVLAILWAGTFLLIGFMIYKWQDESASAQGRGKSTGNLFVDDILLYTGDLELESTSSLINITLNSKVAKNNNAIAVPQQKKESMRTELYNKILNQKIKNAKKQETSGFTIKPLPE